MNIESKDFKIENIFSRRQYIIPDYQRDYSWTVDEEISVFWDDFLYYINSNPKTNFFIGPMVYKAENINASEFEVIDGQQRLITFAILLSVIVSLFKKYDKKDLAEGLRQYLIYKDTKNNEQLVINTVESHPFFQKKIFHDEDIRPTKKKSEQLIEKAREFFELSIEEELNKINKKSEKIKHLESIRDYILNIDTVIIVSNDETDAFTIFETINTRGKDLTSLDLLKNYIFKNYPGQIGVREPKETWKKVTKNIEFDRGTFFNRFWASWILKVTENKLYRRFTDYMRDTKKNTEFPNTKILLEEIFIASKIYKKITKPHIDDWSKDKNQQVFYYIKNINKLFNLKVHYPFLLAIFEEYENGQINIKLLNNTLSLMENFHFVFTHIVSKRASGLDSKYSKYANRIRKEKNKDKVIKDLKKELASKMPKKDEYIEKFKELNFEKNKDTIKFILFRLEKERDPALIVDLELNSIEHLEPKSSKALNVHNIGNLFLLEEDYNSKKGDLCPFDLCPKHKKTVIEVLTNKTKYKTTQKDFRDISLSGKWNRADIDKRTERLAEETYKLFSKL